MDINEEMTTLSQDITSLREAYQEEEDPQGRMRILRMKAAKLEHVASLFREVADAIERGIQRVL